MDKEIENALKLDMTVNITTTGRKSGSPRRIEIWSHYLDGKVLITGSPGTRSWYANLVAHPDFTFHLKDEVKADVPATARPVTFPEERRDLLSRLLAVSGYRQDQGVELDTMVASSPLVEVILQ